MSAAAVLAASAVLADRNADHVPGDFHLASVACQIFVRVDERPALARVHGQAGIFLMFWMSPGRRVGLEVGEI